MSGTTPDPAAGANPLGELAKFALAATERNMALARSWSDALLTTLWVALGSTILPIMVAALAGYAFAWLDFPGRDWLFIGVIALLVVPLQMALIPMFKIYNTLGRAKQDFVPLRSGEARMYVCGMTVYDYCHLGHARVLVVFDIVRRWLRASGLRVTYVR